MKRILLTIPVLCASAFMLGACSGSSQSSRVPSTTTIATSTGHATSSGAAATNTLASVDPCSLLAASQLPQHHLTLVGPSTPAIGVRAREWQRLDPSKIVDPNGYTLGVAFYDDKRLQDLNHKLNITSPYQSFGQHQAQLAKYTDPASQTCEVQLAASTHKAITISVDPLFSNLPNALGNACTTVEQAAPILVANLPANW